MSEVTEIVTVERKAVLSPEQIAERRRAMDADVWLYIKWICGHGADDIERFHRPLAYFLAGDAVRLAASLNTYKSKFIDQIGGELARKEIDWNTYAGLRQLKAALKYINDRISRSMGKTTMGLDVLSWLAARDPEVGDADLPEDLRIGGGPDINIGIASKSDPAAWGMCETICNIFKSEAFKTYYPDRLFDSDPDGYLTKKWIRLKGRTRTEQETIEARGVNSQWYSKHYHIIYPDDLTSTEAKAGEATVEDGIRFISALHGISIAERWGGTRYIFNGTIQGAKDDNAALVSNPAYISTCIPIWTHPSGAPWTIANMMDDGVPVLPELYDVEACRKIRADTIANDALGKLSYLQNFLMCAHNAGSMKFTAELFKRQKFLWITDPKKLRPDGTPVRYIRRYLWHPDWSPRLNDAFSLPKGAACKCYQACGKPNHAYVQFDPFQLPRMMGVDQALGLDGDPWGVGATALDAFGHIYQLKGEYDQGYWKMVPAIALVFRRWGGLDNPVGRIGMESNTWQAMSADWIKRGDELAFLARRIEKLPPTTLAKLMRITNDIYANMEIGTLHPDPDDGDFENCALNYNAASPDTQEDDPMDCVAMSIQLHKQKPVDMEDKTLVKFAQAQERDFAERCDPATWIDTSDSFLEVANW